jgi:rod shape-determining protein MreD
VILTVLGLRSEAGLILGFLSGLLHDLVVGNTVVGLRAFTYTSVAFLALRTRTRTAAGLLAISLWAGGLTLLGRVLLLVLGILFGQSAVIGGQLMRQIVLVPATNAILAGLLAVPVELAIGRRSA